MKKIFLLFSFLFFSIFNTSADCPSQKEVWNSFQKILKTTNNQLDLIKLKNICRGCSIKDSTYTKILQKIAQNYILNQDYIHANSIIQEAILLNNSTKSNINSLYLIDNYILLAEILNEQGFYQKSLNIYETGIKIANNFPQKSNQVAQFYARKANILTKIGDFEKAIIQAKIGLQISEQNGCDSLAAKCLIEKAKAHLIMGDSKNAKDDLKEAIRLLHNSHSSDTLANAYYLLAQLFNSEQKFLESINFYKKAQTIFDKSKNITNYSVCFLDIGFAFYYLKEYDKAIENYEKGLKTNKNINQKIIFLDRAFS